ncbi:50S ribosome-binding GTPase [Leptotrichia sp. oral taxon 218]|jgi:GTP-binding protein HSR1-related|uniref:GTPase family protein n=1 Tax=Leptotrichia TaxID=32067 RepID=UPI001B8C4849|nr:MULTISPECIES: GTPase [Leptotrichia]MBS6018812.1 50S ribosome-binding GTPase [Leptotrichia wadei]QUB94724.1 50S ribosome-binding GTPase [Leptotrichia sp. oral taxon 218]QUB97431.1 50S ribosome-binding GTPase [Leptotrichia sp. oral taxon 221]
MTSFKYYRKNDIEKKLEKARFRPLDVMVTGVTGAGKSTTLNTIFKKNVATVGNGVDPETMDLDSYSLNDVFRLWDTPGLGDGVANDEIHKRKLVDLLYKTYSLDGNIYGWIDSAIVVLEGLNRDMGSTYTLLNEVIVPNIQADRILVVINQADMAMKGRHWNKETNRPDEVLVDFLERQALSIQNRVKEATGVTIRKPVYYSAEYGYNIEKLLDFIIDNMIVERRPLVRA